MGTFHVDIEIGDPQGERFERLSALVDTGSTYTVVPRPLLERLGVRPHERDKFRLADGRIVEEDIGRTWVRVDGRTEITLVVFGEEGTSVLLGAYTLEGFRLAIDPVGRRLVRVEGLLMLASRAGAHAVAAAFRSPPTPEAAARGEIKLAATAHAFAQRP